jgi:hypothetical protein
MVAQSQSTDNSQHPPFMSIGGYSMLALEHTLVPLLKRNGIRVQIRFDGDLESPAIWQAGCVPILRRGHIRLFVAGYGPYLAVFHPAGVHGRKRPMLFLAASAILELGDPELAPDVFNEFARCFRAVLPKITG